MPVTVFGGGAVQTAYVSFTELDITDNSITLVWPTSYFDVPSIVDGIHYNVLAASITVNNTDPNTNTITLPDATESSVGSNFIITNIGEDSFEVLKSNGDLLLLIPPLLDPNSFWVQLIDNSTPQGEWQTIAFGAGESAAQASALAGKGLVALSGLLNTNVTVKSIINAPYQVLIDDRAKLLLWETGTGIMNLPLIITPVPDGFYFSLNNEGSGVLTITTLDATTIDNHASITVAPGQSLSIISDGIKWWSLGFGQNIASSNFAPGSALAPSITFTSDQTTGIYYYNTSFPPVTPPGIGFSVSSSQIANFSTSGLYMNDGKNIILQGGATAQTSLISNASYGQLSWDDSLLSPATLRITGTNTTSTLTLGPFKTLSFVQSDLGASINYDTISILTMVPATGESAFINKVDFNSTTEFTGTATFNGDAIFNGTVTLTTLSAPLTIANGGTGQITRPLALNALMPTAPVLGDLLYYDGTDWIRLAIGNAGDFLKVVGGVPAWTP